MVLEEGTLNNSGATLSVGSGGTFNQLTITTLGTGDQGIIAGGIIGDAGNGIVFKGGFLDGVSHGAITYEGTMNVTATSATPYVIISGNTSGNDSSTYLTVTGAGGTGAGTTISAPATASTSSTARPLAPAIQ